jgi:methionine salvage enolase-phosphatase E1
MVSLVEQSYRSIVLKVPAGLVWQKGPHEIRVVNRIYSDICNYLSQWHPSYELYDWVDNVSIEYTDAFYVSVCGDTLSIRYEGLF